MQNALEFEEVELIIAPMPPRARRWGSEQDSLLSDLVPSGEINPNVLSPDYLFDVTCAFSPNFVGGGRTGRATAVQRLQRKFNCILLD